MAGAGKLANIRQEGKVRSRQHPKYGGYIESDFRQEKTDIAASAYTDTTIEIPAGAALEGIQYRVIDPIPGMTGSTMDIGIAGNTNKFFDDVKADARGEKDSLLQANEVYASATKIRITPLSTPSAGGRVRIKFYFKQIYDLTG